MFKIDIKFCAGKSEIVGIQKKIIKFISLKMFPWTQKKHSRQLWQKKFWQKADNNALNDIEKFKD